MELTTVYCILIASGLFVVNATRKAMNPENVKVIMKECQEQEHVTDDDMNLIMHGDFSSVSEAIKCFMACSLEKTEFILNGKFNKDFVQAELSQNLTHVGNATVSKEALKTAIDACEKELVGITERCSIGFKIYECSVKFQKGLKN